MEYTASYSDITYLVNTGWPTVSSLFYTQNSWWLRNSALIFIHHAYAFIHSITITVQTKLLCVI